MILSAGPDGSDLIRPGQATRAAGAEDPSPDRLHPTPCALHPCPPAPKPARQRPEPPREPEPPTPMSQKKSFQGLILTLQEFWAAQAA